MLHHVRYVVYKYSVRRKHAIRTFLSCKVFFLDTFLNTLYNPLVDWGWLPWRRKIL